MATEKGSLEHKCAGLIYLPLSLLALLLASAIAWQEQSIVLFCFNSFCVYLLMSGWRAVHEGASPDRLDWAIPLSLMILVGAILLKVLFLPYGPGNLYLAFFALNGGYLVFRDFRHLQQRALKARYNILDIFLHGQRLDTEGWMGRHIAGMVGSATANLSVIVLTLLPVSLHWLWPVTLLAAALFVARQQKEKRRRLALARKFGIDFQGLKSFSTRFS